MLVANFSQTSTRYLPPALISAQEALNLPKVQAMLKRLSKFQLGIFMPHTHDETIGAFQMRGNDVVQVQSGLQVSSKAAKEIATQRDSCVPAGWFWRGDPSAPVAVCEMVSNESAIDREREADPKMKSKI